MINDKDTNIVYFSSILRDDFRYSHTAKQIINLLNLFNVKSGFLSNTNDIWTRDYMPIQVSDNEFIEFRYDPDYLQGKRKGKRDLKTYPDIVCSALNLKTIKSDIILDGGNIIKGSNCIILTDKIVQENRFIYSKNELIKKLHETFKVEKVVLIPWDKSEVYGHSDGILRFINKNTVLVSELYESSKDLLRTLKQNGLNVEILKVKINRHHKWDWAYINFLQTKDLIVLPKFDIEEDHKAFDQISKYFPNYYKEYRIVQVDMSAVVPYHGALNCISWTIKE